MMVGKMTSKVDNAIIMAAGLSSRFISQSGGIPKGLVKVKGEILLERQIRQLIEAEIPEIHLILGYKAEDYQYLKDIFPIKFIYNIDYFERNNNGSIYAARDILRNSYICSADNYFAKNPFEKEVEESYYAAVYTDKETEEWCLSLDADDYIRGVTIGGSASWYMMGHVFWKEDFTRRFLTILEREYQLEKTRPLHWEAIYMQHLDSLKMKARKYPADMIYEFDTVDDLRAFDPDYRRQIKSHNR
ncbi:MAG: NTP transferase domain-containing protein [Eubacteriales bacterium]|nr:NTP transferase domain-containing protein [Eubacteriales bacterium]